MSDSSNQSEPLRWEPQPIIRWLLEEGRFLGDIDDVVHQLGVKLLASGAPIWRLRLSMRILHPLTTAITSQWERDDDVSGIVESAHGLENRPAYHGSPFEIIGRTRTPFRKRLAEGLSPDDHSSLHELKDRGGTDYFGIPLNLTDGNIAILVCATDLAEGFSDQHIDGILEIASVLAPITEVFRSRRISVAVAEAYLGSRTGRRVLDGQITRGHFEKIEAAILLSDIRDWTGINDRMSIENALALANRYFETIGEAVESHGGEVLKFMGDGILAIFPVVDDAGASSSECERALAAARQATRIARESDPPLDLRFGIGMNFGEVHYGNIGSHTRIDFTVSGQAVNLAARIESLSGKLNQPILFSRAFADRIQEPATHLADELVKGHDQPIGIYGPSNGRPSIR